MDCKETIIEATRDLIIEKGENIKDITVREISKKANVGLGLINYHFGSKEELINICVERMVSEVVDQFKNMQDEYLNLSPLDKLDLLGNLTLEFLLDHFTFSKISILQDLQEPKPTDNTHRTYEAYLPLIQDCRPDWDDQTLKRKTFSLISIMQHSVLRHQEILEEQGVDLFNDEDRKKYHQKIILELLGDSE